MSPCVVEPSGVAIGILLIQRSMLQGRFAKLQVSDPWPFLLVPQVTLRRMEALGGHELGN